MKKLVLTVIAASALLSCKEETIKEEKIVLKYPETKQVDTTDTYFGTEVKDPYRWPEDDKSAETAAWVKAENEVTFGYLEKIPFRKELKERLEKVWNYEKISAPFKEGNYTYYFKTTVCKINPFCTEKTKVAKKNCS